MQSFRTIEVYPPEAAAGSDLRFKDMTGWEGLGRPFSYDVELVSGRGDIDKLKLLGEPMTVAMLMTDAVPTRYWNGVIEAFTLTGWEGDLFTYRARLRPKLAMLARRINSRIFQPSSLGGSGETITVLDILKSVFHEHDLDVSFKMLAPVDGRWNEREYVVQYHESDLDFVHRLMEREGIYYYFRHDNGKHLMVLVDDTGDLHHEGEHYARIPYYPPNEGGSDRRARDHVDNWTAGMQVQSGQFTGKDYDFEAPTAPRMSTMHAPKAHPQHAEYEVYEYPAGYPKDTSADVGPRHGYTERRLEEQQGEYENAVGAGTARGLMPGAVFGLTGYIAEPEERVFLVTWAEYRLATNAYASSGGAGGGGWDGEDYRVRFGAMNVKLQYRPALLTARPTVKGPQTAIVVGTPGSEITTDKYGRVKVKFHWDRAESRDHTSSCFVRVAQVWAGAKWGAMFMPRVGHEVIVDFLEGDPDQPIIVGRVYNKDRMPPYELPLHGTVSTIKSMSSPDGDGFNELRFEDKKGSEQVFIHAQRQMDVRVEKGLFETIGAGREERIGDEGGGDLVRLVSGNVHEHAKGDQLELVDKRLHTNVKGEVVEVFEGDQSTAVTGRRALNAKEIVAEAKQTLSLSGDKVVVQAGQALSLKGGVVKIEATQSLSLKVGGNFVALTPAGVFINGTMVMINSGGAALPADAPLAISAPSIQAPADPHPADNALPGESATPAAVSARQPPPRTVPLQRAPAPPLLPAPPPVLAPRGPAAAPERAFLEIKWVEMETYCGGPATLQGTTRGYADGATETAQVKNAVDGATVVGVPLAISGDAFSQPVEVKNWLPRRAGADYETFRDEIAVAAGKKTPRPLRVKFIPSLEGAPSTLTSPTGIESRFDMVVRNYACRIENEIKYVPGYMGWIIQLGDAVPAGTGGQAGVDWGKPDPNAFSGGDWRYAKGNPSDASGMTFWDGEAWRPVPPSWSDTNHTKLYGIGFWREGLTNKAQYGSGWPEAVPRWSPEDEQAAAGTFSVWKAKTKEAWSTKFDLRRDGCSSTNQSCCRYSLEVEIKEIKKTEERGDDDVIIVGLDNGRSNAKAWSLGDRRPGLAPHEFGHHLGNPDEYPNGVGIDTSVNTDGAQAGIDEACLMGSVPARGLPPIRARHFNIVKRHLELMIRSQKGIAWTFRVVPHG